MQEGLREELENLGIYQLRIYARKVGVKLATTLKKADLIESIINILSGNQEPYIKPTKKGRPAKEYVSNLSTEDVNFANMFTNPVDYGISSLFSPNYIFDEENTSKKVAVSGIVDIFSNSSGVIVPVDGKKYYTFINENLIISNNLKRGDYIEGFAFELSDEMVSVLCEINKLNGFKIDDMPTRSENLDKRPKNELLEFKKKKDKLAKIFNLYDIKIKKGDKILISSKERKMTTISTFNFIDIATNYKDVKIVLLGINITDDFINLCKKYDNVECIGATMGEDISSQLKILELGIAFVKNLVEYTSNHVICVLLNVDNIINICYNEMRDKWTTIFEKLFMSAGVTNAGSLTIVYSMTANANDNFYVELETGANVFLNACDIVSSKQLLVKFDWLSSYCSNFDDYSVGYEGRYAYLLSSFLNSGNPTSRQQQIEYWVNLGLDEKEIELKMEEFLNDNKNV